jgi:predicted nucleotidyltransferase
VTRRRDQDGHFSSGLFSHVFVRGVACRNAVIERGWLLPEQVSILLSGFDPEIFKRDTSIEKDIDILFVGSITERRKRILSELQKEFHVEWQKVYGTELSLYINRAKIVLNIHAEEYLDVETRVFEVLGSGGFLITEKLAQENPFKDGVHLIETENIEEMSKKIRWYLSHDQERNEISDHGYKEAVRSHTYDSRALFVTDIVKKYTKSTPSYLFDQQLMKKIVFREKLRGIVVIPIFAGVTFLRKIKKAL